MSKYTVGDVVGLRVVAVDESDKEQPVKVDLGDTETYWVFADKICAPPDGATVAAPKSYVARFVYEVAVEEASGLFHAAQLATEALMQRHNEDIRDALYLLDVREGGQ